MLGLLKKLFGGKTEEAPKTEAPYKVEPPTTVAEKATEAMVESVAPAAWPFPDAQKPAEAPKKKAPAKKTAAKKTTAKKSTTKKK